jgi:hypothetical protein
VQRVLLVYKELQVLQVQLDTMVLLAQPALQVQLATLVLLVQQERPENLVVLVQQVYKEVQAPQALLDILALQALLVQPV